MGTHLPSSKGSQPQFSAHICCGQMAESIKMPLGRDVGIGRSNIVLDGDPAPHPQRSTAPPLFSAHICCGQMAESIKMPLGTEVDVGPGHIVLDGNTALPLAKGAQQLPSFRPMSIVAKVAHLSYC